MAGIRESEAKETFLYKVEPQILATVCQEILGKVGTIKQVSKETGMISGKIKPALLSDAATIVLRISRNDDSTELNIQTNRGEALLTNSGAQKAMMKFTTALGNDERLKGKSVSGW